MSNVIRVTNLEFLTTCEARFGFSMLDFPQKSSLAAERGTYLHDVFHKVITADTSVALLPPRSPYNDDLIQFQTKIQKWWNSYTKQIVLAEQRLQIPIDGSFILSGKPDVIVQLEDTTLKIIDLKTGKNVEHYLYSSQLPLYSFLVTYSLKLSKPPTRVSILDTEGTEYERTLNATDFEYAYVLTQLGVKLINRGVFQKSFGCSCCDFYEYCIGVAKNYITFEQLKQLRDRATKK